MVSFICNACGNTVKKNQVEKHYKTQCHSCSVLSCIDCGVDFPGDAYISHTSCITEAEKYQGHLYQAKDKENKGEAKQKEWVKNLQTAGEGVTDPRLRSLLQKITEYSNIPRKKKKFENFCKNSVKVYDEKTLNALWDVFSASNEPISKNDKSSSSVKEMENGHSDSLSNEKEKEKSKLGVQGESDEDTTTEEVNKEKKKKRKMGENTEVTMNNETTRKKKIKLQNIEHKEMKAENDEELRNMQGKFNWHKAIKTALKESDDKELPVKKLRKKIISAYQEHGPDNRATTLDDCRVMFEKKLSTYSKVKVKKDVVKLV